MAAVLKVHVVPIPQLKEGADSPQRTLLDGCAWWPHFSICHSDLRTDVQKVFPAPAPHLGGGHRQLNTDTVRGRWAVGCLLGQ